MLDAELGADLTRHPMQNSFKAISLNQVVPLSCDKVAADMLRKIAAEFKAIG